MDVETKWRQYSIHHIFRQSGIYPEALQPR